MDKNLLRGLFKGTPSGAFLKLAYITGILPIKKYGTEISLSSVVALAYYSACRDYTLVRELPAGNGFADMVFLPKRTSINPTLVLELKWNKTAEGAKRQIKKKEYVAALKEYKRNILLVGINYEEKSKKHQCRIEKVEI